MTFFIVNHGGGKVSGGSLIPNPNAIPQEDHDVSDIDLSYEETGEWRPIPFSQVTLWGQNEWNYSPVRFVDGKDVGKTAARLFTPDGFPIPIRVSHIGGITMRVCGRGIQRESVQAERVVSMVTQPFPWHEVEEFAIALQQAGLRLLPAVLDPSTSIWDYPAVLRATDNRSRDEMFIMEETVLSQASEVPTIVDGRLEAHSGGFNSKSHPVFGVIKTHQHIPFDLSRLRLLYALQPGERLPAFIHAPGKRLTTLTWYLRIAEAAGESPLDGVVRIEVSLEWYETFAQNTNFVDRLSRLVMAYRCQDQSYSRANISLEPIVRGERQLGAVFGKYDFLFNQFLHISHLN
jgi:hypothetical protein